VHRLHGLREGLPRERNQYQGAQGDDAMTVSASQRFSYDLDAEMLKTIGEEFDSDKITRQFADVVAASDKNEVEEAGRQLFVNYGGKWMERSLELGEKHTDATYETLKKAIAKTGVMYFPLVPQRFVEIAYLSVMSFLTLKVVQNNGEKLAYRLAQCDIYNGITEKNSAEVANLLPCRHGCLTALETLFRSLNIDVKIEMEAVMPKEGYCQFAASRV